MPANDHPLSIRVNDEDKDRLDYLKQRLGMKPTAIIRLALRRLYDFEKKLEK